MTDGTDSPTKPGTFQPGHKRMGGRRARPKLGQMKARQRTAHWLDDPMANEVGKNILRAALNRPMRLRGPTGKQVWVPPEPDERRWAVRFFAERAFPEVRAVEHTGEDGEAIRTEDVAPVSTFELGRRIGLLLSNADPGPGPSYTNGASMKVISGPENDDSDSTPSDPSEDANGHQEGGNGQQDTLSEPRPEQRVVRLDRPPNVQRAYGDRKR